MKTIILLIVLELIAGNVSSQHQVTKTEYDVLQVIDILFDGMRSADSALVHSVFTDEARLYSVFSDRNGKAVLHNGSLQAFLNAIGTAHEERWDEPIWDTEVKIDGQFAQVWTSYAFYAGSKFSHCGVDAFHLFHAEDGWKIFHLTDTRQYQDCQVPEEIQNRFK